MNAVDRPQAEEPFEPWESEPEPEGCIAASLAAAGAAIGWAIGALVLTTTGSLDFSSVPLSTSLALLAVPMLAWVAGMLTASLSAEHGPFRRRDPSDPPSVAPYAVALLGPAAVAVVVMVVLPDWVIIALTFVAIVLMLIEAMPKGDGRDWVIPFDQYEHLDALTALYPPAIPRRWWRDDGVLVPDPAYPVDVHVMVRDRWICSLPRDFAERWSRDLSDVNSPIHVVVEVEGIPQPEEYRPIYNIRVRRRSPASDGRRS
jgi:hypothetical protein